MRDSWITTLLTTAVIALLLIQPSFVTRADWRTYDFLNGFAAPPTPSGNVAIVTVDEASLARLGRWPWPRDVLALIIEKIVKAGASAVVMDVMFPEPDLSQSGVLQLVRRGVIETADFAAAKPNDEILADVVGKGRVVAGHYFDFQNTRAAQDCVLHPLPMLTAVRGGSSEPALFHAAGVVCTLPVITRAAAGTGFLNAAADADGLVRRVPLLVEYGSRKYASLALATMLALRPATTLSLEAGLGSEELHVANETIPIDARGRLLIRFRGRGSFVNVSAADVVRSAAVAGALANKVVIVGGSAAGLQDIVATPVDSSMLGVEVQANLTDNLLRGDFVQRSGMSGLWEALLIVLGAVTTAMAVHYMRPIAGTFMVLVLLALLWTGAGFYLLRGRVFVSPILPTVSIAANFACRALTNWGRQRAKAEKTERELKAMRRFTLAALTVMTEVRHADTGGHSKRLQRYMKVLCEALADHPRFSSYLTPERVSLLIELTPIHDIGKVGTPDSVLLKEGPLTVDEIVTMRQHVEHGLKILERARMQSGLEDETMFQMACEIVSAHHERWDGNGYPNGLRGESIPIGARLLAVADVYDALVSRRVYKESIPHRLACECIQQGRGTHFDPDIADALLSRHDSFETIAVTFRKHDASLGAGA